MAVPFPLMSKEEIRAWTGRPLKFSSPQVLMEAIEKYFEETPEEMLAVSGLALYLGTTREKLMDYQERDAFRDIVKMAKLRIELSYEQSLRKSGRVGDIFALKQFGWKDKQEIDQTVHGSVDLSFKDSSTEELLKLAEADIIDI